MDPKNRIFSDAISSNSADMGQIMHPGCHRIFDTVLSYQNLASGFQ
jgi:hypothetical protein